MSYLISQDPPVNLFDAVKAAEKEKQKPKRRRRFTAKVEPLERNPFFDNIQWRRGNK